MYNWGYVTYKQIEQAKLHNKLVKMYKIAQLEN